MDEACQTLIPDSFVALFIAPGQSRLQAARSEIATRYELCEDMAQLLTGPADQQRMTLGVTEADVLLRVRRGLVGDAAVFTPPEADWIVRRLAELLDWPPLAYAAPGDALSA